MPIEQFNGVPLFYEEIGAGAPVVSVHGTTGSPRDIVDALSAIVERLDGQLHMATAMAPGRVRGRGAYVHLTLLEDLRERR